MCPHKVMKTKVSLLLACIAICAMVYHLTLKWTVNVDV